MYDLSQILISRRWKVLIYKCYLAISFNTHSASHKHQELRLSITNTDQKRRISDNRPDQISGLNFRDNPSGNILFQIKSYLNYTQSTKTHLTLEQLAAIKQSSKLWQFTLKKSGKTGEKNEGKKMNSIFHIDSSSCWLERRFYQIKLSLLGNTANSEHRILSQTQRNIF